MIVVKRSVASVAQDLSMLRAAGVAHITEMTGTVRRKYITDIAGQDMIYLEKEQEAKAYIAEVTPPVDLGNYPFLGAEVIATSLTAYEVAQIVLYKAASWRVIGAQIETLRMVALASIEIATLEADILAVVAGYQTSTEAI